MIVHSQMESGAVSRASLWAGRIVSGLVVVFLLFDSISKLMRAPQVIEATARIGFPENTIVPVGVTLLVCTLIYIVPSTSVLGAILLTGYLGGAAAADVRAGSPAFNTGFAVTIGVLVWVGLYLRESRLRGLLPLRRSEP